MTNVIGSGGGALGVPKFSYCLREVSAEYLVLGCGYTEADDSVVGVLQQYASHVSAQVIHLGPVATREEVQMYRFRQKKLKTWEAMNDRDVETSSLTPDEVGSILEVAIQEMLAGALISEIDFEEIADMELEYDDVRVLRARLRLAVLGQQLRGEIERLRAAQEGRVRYLTKRFPGIKFVYGQMDVLDYDNPPIEMLGSANLGPHFRPSKYIGFAAMMANGPKTGGWPLTSKTARTLKSMHHSWVLPHPIIQAESFAKPGLNNASNYFTTGRLSHAPIPTHTSEAYFARHLAGAVAVTMDADGTFFARNLIVEQTANGDNFTIEDDVLFLDTGSKKLQSEELGLGIADTHTHYDNKGTMAIFHATGQMLRPSGLIHAGDASDMEPVSRHLLGKAGQMENKRLGKALHDLREHLAFIRSINPQAECVLIDSNHHEWLTQYLDTNPALKDLLSWESLAPTFEGWNVMLRKAGENAMQKIGDLTARHGDQESVEQAEAIFGKYWGGHFHRFRRLGRTLSVGPACNLGPNYLQQAITAWQNQITTFGVYWGVTIAQAKTVLHVGKKSKTVFRGQILEVSFEK